jgi:hypothetical protein
VEKRTPPRRGASKPGLGHAGAGGRRYVTAVGRGGLESSAGTQPIELWWFCLGSGHVHLARLRRRPISELPSKRAVPWWKISGSPMRGGATTTGISPAASQQCLRRSRRRSPAMLTGSLRLMEISTASSRQAMTTDKRLARKRACGVGSLTPSPESKPALKNRSSVTNFVTVRRGRQKRKSRQVRNSWRDSDLRYGPG